MNIQVKNCYAIIPKGTILVSETDAKVITSEDTKAFPVQVEDLEVLFLEGDVEVTADFIAFSNEGAIGENLLTHLKKFFLAGSITETLDQFSHTLSEKDFTAFEQEINQLLAKWSEDSDQDGVFPFKHNKKITQDKESVIIFSPQKKWLFIIGSDDEDEKVSLVFIREDGSVFIKTEGTLIIVGESIRIVKNDKLLNINASVGKTIVKKVMDRVF